MNKALLAIKTVAIHTCFIMLMSFAMNFVLDAKNAHSFSLFEPGDMLGPSLVGTWEETGDWLNVNLVFYPDGRVTIGPFHLANMRYTVKNGFIALTVSDIWGGKSETVHKATIDKNRLTLDPGIYMHFNFIRSSN